MMQDDEGGTARPFAAGLLIGGLLGAGLALLFAPQSGADTRRMIRKKAKKIAVTAEDRFDDVKGRIRQARRKAESTLSD